jgi:predicted nuclease of predicted toxin-antitoxin system
MKLLLDMNLSPRWLRVLADAGFEAVHWSACGKGGAADTEIMGFAKANDYVVLTYDLDFSAILAATGGTSRASCRFAPTTSAPMLSARISCARCSK